MKVKEKIVQVKEQEFWLQVDEQGNALTGEIKSVDVVIKEIPRAGFAITYIGEIIKMLDAVGNKKMKVVKYILQNMDSNNKLNETTDEISKNCQVSKPVVIETLKLLESIGVIARKTGLIMLSPKFVHKGNAHRERFLMTKFYEIKGSRIIDNTEDNIEQPMIAENGISR